jgi:hypothetical protein
MRAMCFPNSLFLLVLLPNWVLGSLKVALSNGRASQCQALWTESSSTQVGSVCIETDSSNPEQLGFSFATADGWKLDETQLWIGRNMSEVPLTTPLSLPLVGGEPTGEADGAIFPDQQPDLERFPYLKNDLSGKYSHFGFAVKLWYLGFVCPDAGTEFYAVAHASVAEAPSLRSGAMTKTSAWAGKEPFADGSTLWLNFSFKLVCDVIEDLPVNQRERHFANLIPQ